MVDVWWVIRNDENWVQTLEQDAVDKGIPRWAFYRRTGRFILFDHLEFWFTNTKGWRFDFSLAGGNEHFTCLTFRNGDHCVDFDDDDHDDGEQPTINEVY